LDFIENTLKFYMMTHIDTQVIRFIPYSEKIKGCFGKVLILFQFYLDSLEYKAFKNLAYSICDGEE